MIAVLTLLIFNLNQAMALPGLPSLPLIYGADERFIVDQKIENKWQGRIQMISQGVAAQIDKKKLLESDDSESLTIKAQSLNQELPHPLCEGERFGDLPNVSDCSGFLVGEDLLLTAGHCMKEQGACENKVWVFDYRVDKVVSQTLEIGLKTYQALSFKKKNIYTCQKVLSTLYSTDAADPYYLTDYALIQLDRKVEDRTPLKYRGEGKVDNKSTLAALGHPVGAFQILAAKGRIRDNSRPFSFNTNLDTFQGNSGSPVFDRQTGLVEGILTRGDRDFLAAHTFSGERCTAVKVCVNSGCEGDEVNRIPQIEELTELKAYDKTLSERGRKAALMLNDPDHIPQDLESDLPNWGQD